MNCNIVRLTAGALLLFVAAADLGAADALGGSSPTPAAKDAAGRRAEVQADWQFQYRTMGAPNVERDLKSGSRQFAVVRLLENESNGPVEEPWLLDRHAAFWPEDRDQCDVVCRRTAALLGLLAADNSKLAARWEEFGERLAKLKERLASTKPDRHGADPARKALYFDLCALRREIALANPLLDFEDLLFMEVCDAGTIHTLSTDAPQQSNWHVHSGTGLYVMHGWKTDAPRVVDLCARAAVENGPNQGRCLSGGWFHSPSLSYDAKTVYFSWADPNAEPDGGRNRGPGRYSHIFRIGIDGSGLRQLTFGPYNDFDCCELPDGRLVFMSTRREGYDRCGSFRPATFLHSMKADGSDIQCLSFHETHEWHCSVDNHGMIVYTRWDYVDRCVGDPQGFWRCYPDGRDARAPFGNYFFPLFDPQLPLPAYADAADLTRKYPHWMTPPKVQSSIRAVPGTRSKYTAVDSWNHSILGPIILIDLSKRDDYRHSAFARITPRTNGWAFDWGTPQPLSEDFYLASYYDRMYLLDRFGNRELAYHMANAEELDATNRVFLNVTNRDRAKKGLPSLDREEFSEFDGKRREWRPLWPTPVRARSRPPVIPTQTWQSEDRCGQPGHKPATLAVLNVYAGDVPLPPNTKVKWLRLVQVLSMSSGQYQRVEPANQGGTVSRLPLGVVPVEEDGSVYCEAPIKRGLYFQLLNEDGLAVQSMRSLTYVHPGEQLTCVGCHEPYDRAPTLAAGVPLAMRRPPSQIQPEFPEGVVPPDYEEQIAPIFRRTCAACHTKEKKGPATDAEIFQRLAGHREKKADGSWSKVHGPWVRWGWPVGVGRGAFARTTPGYCGALNSPLWEHVQKRRQAFTPEDLKRLAWWVDLSCPLVGGYRNYYTEPINGVRWPIHQDLDPANPLGLEIVPAADNRQVMNRGRGQ